MDNFHCACYCWSSEPKGKEKNDFDNIIMGYWYFFMNEDYDSVSLLYSCNKLQGLGGEVNGHAVWEKLKFLESQKLYFGVMGYLVSLFKPL